MQELFANLEMESLSPRLKWMQKHNLTIMHHPQSATDSYCVRQAHTSNVVFGDTKDDALCAMALLINKPLWNEEQTWNN